MVTVRKRDGDLVLIFVAAWILIISRRVLLTIALKPGILTHNAYIGLTVKANRFGIPFASNN